MKIGKNISNNPFAAAESHITESSVKNLNDLKHGDRFKAVVTDITPGNVSLKLASGQAFTAKSMVLPEARIGEEAIFAVKENIKGQILLEMVKNDKSASITGIVKEALKNASMAATPDNINLVSELIKNNIPPDKDTLQKAAFFKYAGSGIDLEGILFLLKEGFEASVENVNALNRLLDKSNGLNVMITEIASEILKLDSSAQKRDLLGILIELSQAASGGSRILDENSNNGITNRNIQKHDEILKNLLALKPEKANDEITKLLLLDLAAAAKTEHNALKEYFKGLSQTLARLITHVNAETVNSSKSRESINDQIFGNTEQQNMPQDNLAGVRAKLEAAAETMKFLDQIHTQKEYLQIPFYINGESNKSELYVYKDSTHKNKNSGTLSALIALDLAALGHVECLISKSGKNIGLNFKLKNDYVMELVKKNSNTLIKILTARNYNISSATFIKAEKINKTEKQTTLTSPPPGSDIEKAEIRYTFDMRM